MVRNLALCTTVGKREGALRSSVYVRYTLECDGLPSLYNYLIAKVAFVTKRRQAVALQSTSDTDHRIR